MTDNSRTSSTHPGRILIVDDERQNRQLLEVMLAAGRLCTIDRGQR